MDELGDLYTWASHGPARQKLFGGGAGKGSWHPEKPRVKRTDFSQEHSQFTREGLQTTLHGEGPSTQDAPAGFHEPGDEHLRGCGIGVVPVGPQRAPAGNRKPVDPASPWVSTIATDVFGKDKEYITAASHVPPPHAADGSAGKCVWDTQPSQNIKMYSALPCTHTMMGDFLHYAQDREHCKRDAAGVVAEENIYKEAAGNRTWQKPKTKVEAMLDQTPEEKWNGQITLTPRTADLYTGSGFLSGEERRNGGELQIQRKVPVESSAKHSAVEAVLFGQSVGSDGRPPAVGPEYRETVEDSVAGHLFTGAAGVSSRNLGARELSLTTLRTHGFLERAAPSEMEVALNGWKNIKRPGDTVGVKVRSRSQQPSPRKFGATIAPRQSATAIPAPWSSSVRFSSAPPSKAGSAAGQVTPRSGASTPRKRERSASPRGSPSAGQLATSGNASAIVRQHVDAPRRHSDVSSKDWSELLRKSLQGHSSIASSVA